jgi:N utilization substance protein B
MGARSKARKRALDILFESEQRGLAAGETLADRQAASDQGLNPYTVALVEGVRDHLGELDAAISAYSTGWPLDRMPAVDRTILRLAVFELRYVDEVPTAVALDEAVSLARELSTHDSPSFVNGLLAAIAAHEPIDPQ